MSNFKNFANGIAVTMLFAAALVITVRAHSDAKPSDPAAYYKTKCVACHGKTAEKKFDSSLPEAQMIEIVLKGKKPEKPPNMPAFEERGITADQAKALAAYMKSIK